MGWHRNNALVKAEALRGTGMMSPVLMHSRAASVLQDHPDRQVLTPFYKWDEIRV